MSHKRTEKGNLEKKRSEKGNKENPIDLRVIPKGGIPSKKEGKRQRKIIEKEKKFDLTTRVETN